MIKNQYWINFNFNPYKQRIGDCSIRAIVAAIGLAYREVCNRLHKTFKKGKGLLRDSGIDLEDVKKVFQPYFDVIEDFYEDNTFIPPELEKSKANADMEAFDNDNMIGLASGITLNEFVDMFKNQGSFLVSLEPNPESDDEECKHGDNHIVCVKCIPGIRKQGFIDIWDSGDMLVNAYMRVAKTEPKDSPLHWKYDYEKHQFIV